MALQSTVVDGLNAQLGRELEAHLQYLAISSWFNGEGLPELTRFFAAQAAEEHVHAMKFLTYIQDAGGDVAIPALAAPAPSFTGAEGRSPRPCPRRRTSPHASTIWSTSREARTTMPPMCSCSGS